MSFFDYKNGELHAENLAVSKIAKQVGTPCYVYSRAALETHWKTLDNAFGDYPHLICYAVKANSNLAVLNVLAHLGSGFDIVSEGELQRVINAGGDPSKVVFSGVAKTHDELRTVIKAQIRSINIESEAELERVQEVAAELGMVAPIAIRVNPDVDAQTHPYIATGLEEAKFGIDMENAFKAYKLAATMPNVKVHGIACHIGSQITQTTPFTDALDLVLAMVKRLADAGIKIEQLDLGGGLGIRYADETPPSADDYVQAMLDCVAKHDVDLPIAIEPGRAIAGNAGIMLTQIEYLKHNNSKSFAIVDAGMNDLMRPSLYQAFHDIVTTEQNPEHEQAVFDVVGPVCETGDVLGYDRSLRIQQGDLLAVKSAGAYGWVMASSYNSRPRPPEIMIDGDTLHVVRRRETVEELMQGETLLP